MIVPGSRPLWVLAVSAVLGFRVGYVAFPSWQVAVQTAQVVAGIVHYPADNPFYIYHTKLWTLLHQVGAVLLRAGVSEMRLSMWLSGVLGMLSFAALALFVYAFGRSALLAIGCAFLIFYTRGAEYGVVYPVVLMGTEHTYGVVGLSTFVLVMGLLGTGCAKLGGFVLGLAPALHPSLGAWLWLTAAMAAVWDRRAVREEYRAGFPYLLAGALVTAISLFVQIAFIYEVPDVDPAVAQKYLSAFIAFWDGHRQPVNIWHPGVALNGLGLMIALGWLRTHRDLSGSARFLLRLLIVSACLSLVFVGVSWIPPGRLPLWLVTLMPARLLNVGAMTFAALLFGLLYSLRGRVGTALISLALAAGLLLGRFSMLWQRTEQPWWTLELGRPDPFLVLVFAGIGLIALVIVPELGSRRTQTGAVVSNVRSNATVLARPVAWTLTLAVFGVLGYAASQTWTLRARLLDWTSEPVFIVASQEQTGFLASSSAFHLAQLFSRRPVLINGGALDTLSYAPEGGPAMDRILRDVYGFDLLHPPAGVSPGGGAIPDAINRPVWESFSREQWQAIRRTYDVTQVLTDTSYELKLPVAAQSRNVRLYEIP
jgi:hypothetical protein